MTQPAPAPAAPATVDTPDAALPSGDAAIALVQTPSVRTLGGAVGTMLLRGLIIGAGLYIFTDARGRKLLSYTAAATGAVEIAVLAWATQVPKPKAAAPAATT